MNDSRPLTGKVALVTGASSGLGFGVAMALAGMGASVATVSRDPERGKAARAEIIRQTGNPAVEFMAADLSLMREVRAVAEQFSTEYAALHLLVNNAGAIFYQRETTDEGLEQTIALNYLAPFLLTRLLLDRLRASAPARIVNVVTGLQPGTALSLTNLQGEEQYSGWNAYFQSKQALLLFTVECAQRLAGTGVTANCVHPGVFRSNFGRNNERAPLPVRLATPLIRPFLKAPENAIQRVIYLATSGEVNGVSGRFFGDRETLPLPRQAADRQLRQQLWEASERLVGIAERPGGRQT
jgi:NAD(P)-dependent dehydrogenase (short-subunit alcohol dehydrogenase family)